MNIRERAGNCMVILINCTLNPVEMDHWEGREPLFRARARAHIRVMSNYS